MTALTIFLVFTPVASVAAITLFFAAAREAGKEEAMAKTRKAAKLADPLPCPCCGEANPARWDGDNLYGLNVGTMSSSSEGVRCYSCGLKMELDWMNRYGERCRDPMGKTLAEALKRWNRRTKK